MASIGAYLATLIKWKGAGEWETGVKIYDEQNICNYVLVRRIKIFVTLNSLNATVQVSPRSIRVKTRNFLFFIFFITQKKKKKKN